MPAYVIVDIEVKNTVEYEEYKTLSTQAVAAYGGRFLARGGKVDVLEGDWQPERLVILEFESVERAVQWWDSPEYTQAKRIRQRTAATNMVVIEGALP
jgi:uncharacterized protein (DUF1330 family)